VAAVLRIGLTGGIGSGKSTAARRLVARGAVLVDSDVLAREVVAPGSEGLAAVVAAFGDGVLTPDGSLDRPGLAAVVFADPAARRRLDAIVHPRVRDRSAELVAAAPADAIVVQDVPLLVETGMAASFPLVVVVDADAEERVRRLVGDRGMDEADARARIAAQAGDQARRAAADVLLDNSGAPQALAEAVDLLWGERLVPFERNLRRRHPATVEPAWSSPDPTWAQQGARLAARISAAAGGAPVEHVGPTAVPGLPAPDVLELVVGASPGPWLIDALAAVGFLSSEEGFASADPGRSAQVRVHSPDSAGWQTAVAFRNWLRVDPRARSEYVRHAECSGGSLEIARWGQEVRSRVDAPGRNTGMGFVVDQGHP